MYLNKLTMVSATAVLLFGLSGCGGGGDSALNTTTATFPTLDVPAAEATVENAAEAIASVIDGMDTQNFSILAVTDIKSTGLDPVAFATKQFKLIRTVNGETHALNEAYSENIACSDSGSIGVTINESSTSGSATMTANSCNESGVVMNGVITMTYTGTNYGDTVSYLKLAFATDFAVTGLTSMNIHGGSYIEVSYTTPLDYYTDIGAGTLKSSIWFESGADQMRYDDLTIAFTQDSYYDSTNCYKSGRIYTGNLTAYLDVDTTYDPSCTDPFVMSNFSVVSGSTRLVGSNGGIVRILVSSAGTYVAVDENGNSLEIVQ